MSLRSLNARLAVLASCFLGALALVTWSERPEAAAPGEPLALLPPSIEDWTGRTAPPFTPEVLAALGVDDHVNRIYSSPGQQPLSVYVGYYASQRTGDTIHSPQNCLPGAGWIPVRKEQMPIDADGRTAPVTINRLVIQKGLDRQVVLYWYQSRGRVVASDYWSKFYLVHDALRYHRSDAAMVRVITPIAPVDGGEQQAVDRATSFVERLFPALDSLLPA